MENRPRILIVDDEPDFAEGLGAALKARSCEVSVATSKTKAQEIAWANKPDAIVVGTMTPRGDAFQLHKWFRETPPFIDVPMIVVDAPTEKQLLKGWRKEEGLQLDAEEYLVKPIDLQPLVTMLEKFLDRTTRKIKVLVVDDHAIIRDGIRALLGVQKDIQVVGEAVDGKDALEKAKHLCPDIVLMDIVMPVMSGLEAAKRITRECERTKVLMLSQYDDEENVMASSQAGAHGFVPKKSASTQLLSAIRSLR